MGDKKAPPDTSSFYAELSKLQQSQEFEKGIKVCNKILNLVPSDSVAFHCKIVCLVQTAKFEDALRQIKDTNLTVDLVFEEAYCLYRLNETSKALDAINQAKNPDVKHKELKAQILYRLERYDDSYAVYRDILKNTSDDEFETERMTNLSAVAANLKKDTKLPTSEDNEDSYEMKYNRACYLLAQQRWQEAEKLLKESEDICKSSLQEDDEVESEDIDRETGIIRVQLAYAIQMQGREKDAQAIYNQVLKSKPTDVALVAVISNNLMTINKDQNIFDSKKKIKAATVDELEHKLTSVHRRTIARNHALLAMFTNQVDLCKTLVKEWSDKYPEVSKAEQDLIIAGVLSRAGRIQDAVDVLLTSTQSDLEKRLIAGQIYLEKGDVKNGIKMLESLPTSIRYRNGILSSLVVLHLASEGRSQAAKLLKDAVEWNAKEKRDKSDMKVVWRKTAEFHLKGDDPKIAAQCLEQLLQNNEKDTQTLAQLVLAYARFDLKKALESSKKLPTFAQKSVDVDALESSSFMGSKLGKKTPKIGGIPSPKADAASTDLAPKKKNKKKRKKRLPKNYNPNVDPDPERWLPRRERTAFKKKKDRRRQERFTGAQGTSAGQSEVFDYSKKTPNPATSAKGGAIPKSPAVDMGVGPRQQQRKPQQKSKKKGKRF